MAAFLGNLRNTVIAGLVLAIIMIVAFGKLSPQGFDRVFWEAVLRWAHVVCGIMWIGLLYYFNFVQTPKMPGIPAELRPAITGHIAPTALFWFRWSALFTVLAGIAVAILHGNDYAANVFTFGQAGGYDASKSGFILMSTGVYLAVIMFLNVWGVIWPNQKKVLGLVEADADAKARAGRIAGMASRINTLLSLPMLTAMAMYQSLYGGG
ncbi:MAG TPA: urate hydroxylase PuuD [Caulobacteraceae bacterium]|nr:urate hydroxylase PuuD [Caulobacteraceae bacterium]